jgi:hypothetical protein
MSFFFPLKSFTNKKSVIPTSTSATNTNLKPNETRSNTQTKQKPSPFEREIIQKQVRFDKNAVSYKKYKSNDTDADDIFKDAKSRNAELNRGASGRALYRGMIERVSTSNPGCKKCGVR